MARQIGEAVAHPSGIAESEPPLLICLLGTFRILKAGCPLALTGGGKAKALLGHLALHYRAGLPRDALLDLLWPGSEGTQASQCLSSLLYSVHKLLGGALADAAPVVHADDCYQLNGAAGVGVDVERFQALVRAGERHAAAGDDAAAAVCYERAAQLYRGDLCLGTDVQAVIEREHLRALYLTVLMRSAAHHYNRRDYAACLAHALLVLRTDPYREDAHRLVMRCYVRRGERAQALRQYRLCQDALRAEFDATPEPATVALFDRVRLAPDTV
ncbi:MAG: bacterial transcriptional activator domain-containing protein [Actinomycetota bacterium]|nr:bacterial transcriptional activator domain-containing protein [Actinomycetota bacterium]